MMWIRLFTGLFVIFFAGKRHAQYGYVYLQQSGIKSPWLRTLIWHVINAFPEASIVFLSASILPQPTFNLALIWGIFLLNFVILSLAILVKKEKSQLSITSKHQISFVFLLGFTLLFLLSLWPKLQASLLHVGWPSLCFLVGYAFYLHRFRFEEGRLELNLPPMVLFLRFFTATLLIFAGAGQVVYGCKELLTQLYWSPFFTAAFLLAPIACLPKIPSLWQKEINIAFFTERVAEANILLVGFFLFFTDVFYLKSDLYQKASFLHLLFALGAIFFVLLHLFLGKMDLKKKKFFSSITILTYFLLTGFALINK